VLVFLLFLFCIFPSQIFAAPTITITNFPENVIAGDVFNITFSISNTDIGSTYHYKIIGDKDTKIKTQPDTHCSSDYDFCENINIVDSSEKLATASAFIDMISGNNNLKIRIAKDNKDSHTTFDSQFISINSVLPTTTPTPTTFPIETPTSTPKITPTPTKTPTPNKVITPTKTPTPIKTTTPTKTPIPTPTLATESAILVSTQTPTQTPTPVPEILGITTTNKKNYLPLVFICLGGLFLLTPLIIAKIKNEN